MNSGGENQINREGAKDAKENKERAGDVRALVHWLAGLVTGVSSRPSRLRG